ncbi:9006_t:CDS:2, partial [Ambispora gerdemannii]
MQEIVDPGTQIPANTNFMHAQNATWFSRSTTYKIGFSNPNVVSEDIPESQEFEHLTKSKKVIRSWARSWHQSNYTCHLIIESVLGKYATAISKKTRILTLSVQGLKEIQHRHEFETQMLDRVLPNGPAVKVGEAVDRLVQVLKIDRVDPGQQLQEPQPQQPHLSQQAGQQEFVTQQPRQQVTPPASPVHDVSISDRQGTKQVDEDSSTEKVELPQTTIQGRSTDKLRITSNNDMSEITSKDSKDGFLYDICDLEELVAINSRNCDERAGHIKFSAI